MHVFSVLSIEFYKFIVFSCLSALLPTGSRFFVSTYHACTLSRAPHPHCTEYTEATGDTYRHGSQVRYFHVVDLFSQNKHEVRNR